MVTSHDVKWNLPMGDVPPLVLSATFLRRKLGVIECPFELEQRYHIGHGKWEVRLLPDGDWVEV